MTVRRTDSNQQIRPAYTPAQAEATKAPEKTGGAKIAAQASGTASVKSDFFKDLGKNIFDAIKKAAPGIKELGQKLLQDPGVKAALGEKDPSKVIDSIRDFAKSQASEKLANAEFKLPSFEKAGEKGKNLPEGMSTKDFVQKGLSGPGGLDIKPTRTGSKEITLSDGQKGAVDKAGARLGQVQNGFAKAQQLADLAKKAGIDVPSYDKSAETGVTKNLYKSADGNHSVDASANAKGSVHAGVDGLKAEGEAKAGLTATSKGSVSTTGKYGTADASYQADALVGAKATGSATLNQDGLNVTGRAEVGVSASVKGQAKVESKPIGGVPGLTAYAGVEGEVKVGANAYAEGSAVLKGNPPTAVVKGEAGAFAGASASVTGRAGVGPVGVEGTAEGWVGVGAKANFEAGFKDNKLTLNFGVGAAVGYGGYLKGGVTIDVGKAKQIAEHVIDKGAEFAKKAADVDGDGKITLKDGQKALENVGNAVESGAKAVGNAVESGAKAVGNAVESGVKAAGKAVGNAVDNVGKGISNIGKGLSNLASKISIF